MPSLLFDMQTGVSGDMVLGALFDLGLDFQAWTESMGALKLPLHFKKTKLQKNGLGASLFEVLCPLEKKHRKLNDIRILLQASDLDKAVIEQSLKIFTRLAEAEARVHHFSVEDVHFHEVGALDSIADITGACLGFKMLDIQDFYTTAFTFGQGTIQTEHGIMAIPVPATAILAEGFPSKRLEIEAELCTPTGTAIVTSLASPLGNKSYRALKTGLGAGQRDFAKQANVLRLQLIEMEDVNTSEIIQIECNLDDANPEILAYAVERIFKAGAVDVWQEPIVMKKSRLATKICALVSKEQFTSVSESLVMETSTLGFRYHSVSRQVGKKEAIRASSAYGDVSVNRITFQQPAIVRFAPEYESCRKAALEKGVPISEVYQSVMSSISRNSGQ